MANLTAIIPAVLKRNRNGHLSFVFSGPSLSGVEEINRLVGFHISKSAEHMLLSAGYGVKHRLVEKEYKVVLLPSKQNGTIEEVRKEAEEHGYILSLAGIAPCVRGAISDERMREMGLRRISTLHDPIVDALGFPSIFCSKRRDDGPWLDSRWAHLGLPLGDREAFAFLDPTS